MKILINTYNLIKRHWVLVCIFIIVIVTAFYPGKTPEQHPGYIRIKEENIPVTSSVPDMQQLMKAVKEQSPVEGDYIYMQSTIKFSQKYPWYQKIPIETGEYIIIYDLDKDSFRIMLKISEIAPESQKNSAINRALQDIKNIGADPKNYYVTFVK
jgi:hypothetical protein